MNLSNLAAMNHDFHYILRRKFDKCTQEAAVRASIETKELIDNLKLNDRNIIDQLIKISALDNELDKAHDELVCPGYSKSHSMEDGIFKLYSTRFLFYQVDESDALMETIILDAKRSAINNLLHEKYELVPKFTLSSLLNSKNHAYSNFYALSTHCSEEEFMKIRDWQSENLSKIVELEYKAMLSSVRIACKESVDVTTALTAIKAKIENLYETDVTTPIEEVISRARALIFFQHPKYTFGNHEVWVTQFRSFQDGKLNHHDIIPIVTRELLKLHKKHLKYPVSSSPFLWLAMQRLEHWLDRIIDGTLDFDQNLPTDFTALFNSAYNNGIEHARGSIEQFSLNNNQNLQSQAQYRESLFDRLDELRYKSRSDAFYLYYRFIETKDITKKIFAHQCFFCENVEDEKKKLYEVVCLSEEINWLSAEIFEIDGKIPFNRKQPKAEGDRWENDYFETTSMMKLIAFDHDLFKKMSDHSLRHISDFNSGRRPIYFCMMDVADNAREIFQEAIIRLQDILERQPQTSKVLYIQDRLKDLRHRELQIKQHGWALNEREKYVREFLIIESDFIKETQHISFTDVGLPTSISQLAIDETLSFRYKLNSTEKLSKIYKFLNAKIDFINETKTPEDNFIAVLTSKNLKAVNSEIHISCETTQFAYIVEKLRQYFSNFNPTTIEKSNLFFSKKGNPISRNNLYANKSDNPKCIDEIDKFFSQLQLQ